VPINTQNLLLKLDPMAGIDMSSIGRMSAERGRLAQLRAELEETKRRNKEDERLRLLAEQGEQARAGMVAETARANREAAAQAALLGQRQEGMLKFTEKAGSGDHEAAEAMIPYLQDLGSGVDVTRNPAGLPSYRTHFDAAADQAQQGLADAQAWQNAERPLDQGVYGDSPTLAAAPDISAPKVGNMLDLQALQDQRLQRLSPMLQDIVQAHPEEYRGIADSARTGIEKAGLPVDKAMQEYRQQLSGPIELAKAQLETQAKDDKLETPSLLEREKLAREGFQRARAIGQDYNFKDLVERRKTVAQARAVLTNKGGGDDYLAGATISRMMGEKGSTTEGDVSRVLGDSASGFLTKIENRLYKEAFDGLSPKQKNALLGVLKKAEEEDKRRAFEFLSNIDDFAGKSTTNPDVARGLSDYRDMVPRDWRDEYEGEKKKRKASEPQKPTASSDPEDFEDDLMLYASEAGLDPDAIRPLVRRESGGDPKAVNKDSGATGIIQFLNDDIAGSVGTSLEALKGMSAQEQLPYAIEYFKTRGINESSTPDDYAMAVAAPGYMGRSDDTVIEEYKKGSDAWTQNPGWRPPGGGDITVGSIKAYYRKGRKGGGESKAAGLPEPKTAAERELYEAMKGKR
jgi:hypothetical protein